VTAFILKPYRDRVEILTDGARYLPDGTVVEITDKVRASAFAPLAITGSGSVAAIDRLADMILQAAEATGSVDATLAVLETSLATIAAEGFASDSPVKIAIGAISETYGPVTLYFATFDEPGAPAPFGFGQGEYPPHEEMVAQGWLPGAPLEKHGPFMFDYMRARKRPNPADPDAEQIYCVGGHLDLTIIRADEYEQRRLVTWPDEVGQKIEPLVA
jgi:hypothetical protein